MKMKFKDKIFTPMLCLFIAIGVITSIIGCINYKNNRELFKTEFIQSVENCKSLNESEESEEKIEWCKKLIDTDLTVYETNASDAYEVFVLDDILNYFFGEFIVIAVVVIGSSYYITKYLRNRIILNNITRENYKQVVKKLFLSSWKYALLFPAMLLSIFITVTLMVDHFQVNSDVLIFSGYEGIFNNNFLLYIIAVLLQSFILSLLYTNISLIVSRKEHNYILSVIKNYLLIVGIEILFEATLIHLFYKFDSGFGHHFNILNMYTYTYTEDGFIHLFVLLGILAVSFIPLFLVYKNKEKLIIDSEKNDNKEEV